MPVCKRSHDFHREYRHSRNREVQMDNMSRLVFFAIILVAVSGCQISDGTQFSNASLPEPNVQVSIPQNTVGQQCVVLLKSQSPKTNEENSGTIVHVDDETIVLSNATRTVRTEVPPPGLGRLPFVARYFKNVGIASADVQGDLRIRLAEIAAVDFVDETKNRTLR